MTENPAFDVSAWLDQIGLQGEAREQARVGFHAGYDWAASDDLGTGTQSEQDAYESGEGHYTNGFDQGRDVYQSDEYPGGLAN
jgi:hypothetical protein